MGHVPSLAHMADGNGGVALRHESLQVAARKFLGELGHQRCVHETWQHAVHADAARSIGNGGGLAEMDQPRLGCRIGRLGLARVANARRGGDADHGSLSLLLLDRQHGLTAEESAFEIDGDLAVPQRLIHLTGDSGFGLTDIVHQHVDAAEARHASLNQPSHLRRIRNVTRRNLAGAALAGDDCLSLPRRRLTVVHAEDARALPGEEHRDLLAIAPARTRRAAAGQEHHLVR